MTLPIACTLSPEALAARKGDLLPSLAREAETREELPNGVRLRFAASPDALPRIASVVEAERHCCRFLRFDVSVEPDGGPISLAVTGPAGAKEFLASLLDDWRDG
jgi:hypothetical protein